MGLLDGNYQDERLNKKVKPAIQGGGYNYLGKEETVTVPKRWLSDPDHVVAELAYITPREAKVLLDLNLYGSLDGKPNNAPGGLPSLQGDMGSVGGGGSSGGGGSGGGGGWNPGVGSPGTTTGGKNKNTSGGSDRPNMAEITGSDLPGSFGAVDPGVAGNWDVNPKTNQLEFTPSTDTITSFTDNLSANIKSSPFSALTPFATLSKTALQTLAANYMMGNITNPFSGYSSEGNPNLTQFEGEGGNRDLMNQLTPLAPYLMTGQIAPQSMVNQYFANQPTSSLSSSLETSYNNAKSNINNILGITAPSQQFGYSQAPYGSYSSTNMADNPYKDYLTTRGLI